MATTPTQDAVPSESPRDLKFNAGKIDEFVTSMEWTYTDRFGVKHYTIEGINYLAQQVMDSFGYVTLSGVTFTTGATLSQPNEILFNTADNQYYKWTGSFVSGGKVVPSGSTPEASGGIGPGKWMSVGDAGFRAQISANDGFKYVGQVKSFEDMRLLTPTSDGQRVLLASYYEGGRVGGGEFISRSTTGLSVVPADNGGTVATVSASWYWERVEQEELFAEDFGAIPFIAMPDAVIPSSAVSASDAFQRMFNSVNYIQMSHGARYLVTTPIQLKGSHWRIIGNKSFVHKKSTEKTNLTSIIPVFGGYAAININCVFVTLDDSRYWSIEGLDIDCHEGPSGDRPVGFYFPQVVNYRFSQINTRGCLYSFWFKNAWQGKFDDVRTNEDILDGWFYDDSRVNSTGVDVGVTSQSATSVLFNKTYSNAPGRYGYNIRDADYMSALNMACDHSGVSSYRFHKVNMTGNCSAESTLGEYFNISGEGVIDIFASVYDAMADNGQYLMTVAGNSAVYMSIRGRTGKANRVNVTATQADVTIQGIWYDGSTTGIGNNNCISGSVLKFSIGRGSGASRIWNNGVLQEVRETQPSYSSTPTSIAAYAAKEARFGVTSATSSVVIPMSRIKEIFPNFNRVNNNYAEWLRVKITNLAGIAYGAIFFCAGNSVVGVKLDNQTSTGAGSPAAVITAISADSTNLTITLTSAIPAGCIVALQPV